MTSNASLKITSDAKTATGKHVMSKDAYVRSQQYTKDLVFLIGLNNLVR